MDKETSCGICMYMQYILLCMMYDEERYSDKLPPPPKKEKKLNKKGEDCLQLGWNTWGQVIPFTHPFSHWILTESMMFVVQSLKEWRYSQWKLGVEGYEEQALSQIYFKIHSLHCFPACQVMIQSRKQFVWQNSFAQVFQNHQSFPYYKQQESF